MPSSICIAEMIDTSIDKNHPTTFLNIGLVNGVLLRTVIDTVNGQLTDTRQRSVIEFIVPTPSRRNWANEQSSPFHITGIRSSSPSSLQGLHLILDRTYKLTQRLFLVYRFLGSKGARLVRVQVANQSAVLALSSRSWINYTHQNLLRFSPLIYDNLDHAWNFSAELCPDGLIGIAGSTLR